MSMNLIFRFAVCFCYNNKNKIFNLNTYTFQSKNRSRFVKIYIIHSSNSLVDLIFLHVDKLAYLSYFISQPPYIIIRGVAN